MSALALLRHRVTEERDWLAKHASDVAGVGQRQAFDKVLLMIEEVINQQRSDESVEPANATVVKLIPASPTQIAVYNQDKSWYHVFEGKDLEIGRGFLGRRPWAYYYATKANGQIVLWEEAPDQTW
jgi:hypothetical protein